MNANPYEAAPFKHVTDMEAPLATILDILQGLVMIAETLSVDEGAVVRRLAWLAMRECKVAEELRGELFRATHPRRDHFEREGWPA